MQAFSRHPGIALIHPGAAQRHVGAARFAAYNGPPVRRLLLAASVFVTGATGVAATKKPVVKEGDGFRVTLAATWAPLPELEAKIGGALPPDVTGGVLAWGDSSAGAALQVMWVQAKEPSKKPVREELESFHATLRSYLENSGGKTVDFELTERGNRITSRHVFTNEPDAKATTLNLSSAGVPKDGRTRSWSAQCVWASPAGKTACEKAVGSFTVTALPSTFQKLPPPAPAAKPRDKKGSPQ